MIFHRYIVCVCMYIFGNIYGIIYIYIYESLAPIAISVGCHIISWKPRVFEAIPAPFFAASALSLVHEATH